MTIESKFLFFNDHLSINNKCGMSVSSNPVSRAAIESDELLEAWGYRDLSLYRCVILDPQYNEVRQGGQVLDAAVLLACGVDVTSRKPPFNEDVTICRLRHRSSGFLDQGPQDIAAADLADEPTFAQHRKPPVIAVLFVL